MTLRVLYLDDEPEKYARALKTLSSHFGFELVTVRTVREAQEQTKKQKFNLIICDANSPKEKQLTPVDMMIELNAKSRTHLVIFSNFLNQLGTKIGGFDLIDKGQHEDKLIDSLVKLFERVKQKPLRDKPIPIDLVALSKSFTHVNAMGKKKSAKILNRFMGDKNLLQLLLGGVRRRTKLETAQLVRENIEKSNARMKPLPGSIHDRLDKTELNAARRLTRRR